MNRKSVVNVITALSILHEDPIPRNTNVLVNVDNSENLYRDSFCKLYHHKTFI